MAKKKSKKDKKEKKLKIAAAPTKSQYDVLKETLMEPLSPQYKEVIEARLSNLNDLSLYKDITDVSREIAGLKKDYSDALKVIPEGEQKSLYFMNTVNIIGYEPAGSVLKKLYPKPFAPYAFLADNYWASDKARREFRIDIERDGWILLAPERSSKKRIKAVHDILQELDIDRLWVDLCDNLNTFGNFWMMWDLNLMGGVNGKPNLLLPEKIVPVFDPFMDEVIAWEYVWKSHRYVLPVDYDNLDHVMTYSMRSRQIGSPALSSLIVEIEADMHATIYNNTVMQKGGLIKGILALSKPEDQQTINYENQSDYSDKVQQMINRKLSGIRGGGQLVAMAGVEDYHDLNKLGEIEGIYQKSSDRTAGRTAMLHGISPERIGVRDFSQYKNKMEVTDSMSISMDNNQYYFTSLVSKYVNEEVLEKRFGIYDVQIQASGEFGSISTSAAEFGLKIAQMGCNMMPVDEFRTKVLHWEPIGGSEGSEYVGNLLNKKNEASITKALGPINLNYVSYGGERLYKHKPKFIKYYS